MPRNDGTDREVRDVKSRIYVSTQMRIS
jgi:hypothetical protein